MVVKTQTKHDALTICFPNNAYGANSVKRNITLNICMRMICDSHTILIQKLQIFMILIPTPIPLRPIPILIPIQVASNSDFDSDSSIMCPDFNSDSNKPGFDSDPDSGI